MDLEVLPPKRVTRARAAKAPTSSATSGTAASAAKSKASSTAAVKPNAARATATATATATTAGPAPAARKSTKRKAREDDHDDESEREAAPRHSRPPPASRTATRAARGPGRPSKTDDSEPVPAAAPAARAARGRPPKKVAREATKEDAPARATRARATKTQPGEQDEHGDAEHLVPAPVKRPRGRPAGTATSAGAGAPPSKPKKSVAFAEPDKENVVPITGAPKRPTAATPKPVEATSATGMRAKPVRKPAGTGRTARPTVTKKITKVAQDSKKPAMPLSPRKASQLSANRDRDAESEDELAMEEAPTRLLHRRPVKPAGGNKSSTVVQQEAPDKEDDNDALAPAGAATLNKSPVRRPPPPPLESSMKSPAKRVEGLPLGQPTFGDQAKSTASPFKASLLQSPAKRMPNKSIDFDPLSSSRQTANTAEHSASPLRASVLQSPAKRIPLKRVNLEPLSNSAEQNTASPFTQSLLQSPAKHGLSPCKPAKASEPEGITDTISPALTPVLLCSPRAVQEDASSEAADAKGVEAAAEEDNAGSFLKPDFDGRMSTLLPRDVDPSLDHAISHVVEPLEEDGCETAAVEQDSQMYLEGFDDPNKYMDVGESEAQIEQVAVGDVSTTPPNSPPKEALSMFGLRKKDMVPFDTTYSESEEEVSRIMAPKSVSPMKRPRGGITKRRTSGIGFTPLARRLDEWPSRSPHKSKTPKTKESFEESLEVDEKVFELKDSPKDTFFDDEMSSRPAETNESANDINPLSDVPEMKDPVMEDISITEEDLELAAEANEMSALSPSQVESMLNLDGSDGSVSEASQKYGDESEVPGQMGKGVSVPPSTPQRRIRREFHTVSKVPLKAADESTPPPQPSWRKRRHSVSRMPATRPTHQMSRSATVISYSPDKTKQVDTAFAEAAEEDSSHERSRSLSPPKTPSKPEAWAGAETPGRTPRRDADPELLRGAVVFVDVHTVEGADASALFVELLTQMGAECLKTWQWNPKAENASSTIGITHVLFKDGSKRTMEKVRETGGTVHCVGVSWVLDCERENQWLEEASYYIDTGLMPRGGARRKTSTEPKALANVNGTLVPSSTGRKSARESLAAPSTPAPSNRRDSSLWVHSPDDLEDFGGDIDLEGLDLDIPADESWYHNAPLTPVPKTPAPEAIHRFAMEVSLDSPTMDEHGGEDMGVDELMSREHLIQQTCPPKAQHMYQDLGAGVLGLERDQSVARRLMNARRKSLAFAPKISSPLARSSWKDWN